MKNKVYVHLSLIAAEFDPQAVSADLKLTPTSTRTRNHVLENGKLFGHAEWSISLEEENSNDVEIQIKRLINSVNSDANHLREISIKYDAEWHLLVGIVIYDDKTPAICLSPEAIKFLADIHAHVGFDIC